MTELSRPTINYLVPAQATTHVVVSQFLASAVPYTVNWREFSVNQGYPFYPQGAFVDNSQGNADLVITINPLGYTFKVPAGFSRAVSFPATTGDQVATITGNGQVSIYWADFPVLPDSGGQVVLPYSNTNPLPVEIPAAYQPVSTQPTATASGGSPYQIIQSPFSSLNSTHRIAVTTTASAAQALDTGSSVRVANLGTVPVYVAFGGSAVTAAIPAAGSSANAFPILPSSVETFAVNSAANYISAIVASGSADIYVTAGNGA